jgi:hypothetical protein
MALCSCPEPNSKSYILWCRAKMQLSEFVLAVSHMLIRFSHKCFYLSLFPIHRRVWKDGIHRSVQCSNPIRRQAKTAEKGSPQHLEFGLNMRI